MVGLEKIKSSISASPLGGAAGAVVGYVVCKHFGFHKTLSVIGFVMVGTLIGAAIGAKIKNK